MLIEFTDEKHINEQGGQQTKLPVRCDLIPMRPLLAVAAVLAEGAEKYGEWNWEMIDPYDHINHALTHVFRWLTGDRTEPHIVHALCRLLFAQHLLEKNRTEEK